MLYPNELKKCTAFQLYIFVVLVLWKFQLIDNINIYIKNMNINTERKNMSVRIIPINEKIRTRVYKDI